MSKSYTPGLKIIKNTKVSKIRLLPMKGTIVAKLNSEAKHEDVVASTKIPGNVHLINVARELNVEPNKDKDLVAITPAMGEGSGMNDFSKIFPERYYDVAIAEQHSVSFAAGLACEGLKPVVAIYSTFLQRAYDQLIHDVAI